MVRLGGSPGCRIEMDQSGRGRAMADGNANGPHSSLDPDTPDQAHFNALRPILVTALGYVVLLD